MPRPAGVRETKPRNTAARKWSAELAATGTTPVQFLQRALWEQERIIDDEESTETQRHAAWVFGVAIAEKVAPYLAPKLSATTLSGPGGGAVPIEVIRRVIVDPAADHNDRSGNPNT